MLGMRLHGGDFPGTPARPAEQRLEIRAQEKTTLPQPNKETRQ